MQPKAEPMSEAIEVEALPVETETLSPLEILLGVITRPYRTFQRMREARHGYWWLMFVIALLTLLLVTAVSVPIEAEIARAAMAAQMGDTDTSQLPADQQAQIQQAQNIASSQAVLGAIGLVGGAVGTLIGYLVRAGVLFLVGLALGGHSSFKQVWRMAVWTTFPDAVRSLVAGIAILATGNLPSPGLGFIFTSAEASAMSPVLLTFLQGIDIYLVWSLVLIGLGVSATAQLNRVKSALVTFTYWALVVIVTLGYTAITASISRAFTGA
jgi:hypothetical protein